MAASFGQHENVGEMAVVPDGPTRSLAGKRRWGAKVIAKALGIGRASVYRVLEAVR